jgi:hypothetical protein
MADRDVRAFQRDASDGDPEAQRRYQRQFCRQNGHRWTRYKGGPSVCEACGATEPPPEPEEGNQTVYFDYGSRQKLGFPEFGIDPNLGPAETGL